MKVTILVGYEKVNERLHNTGLALKDWGFSVSIILWRRGSIQERQRTPAEENALDVEYLGSGAHETRLALLRNFIGYHAAVLRKIKTSRPDVVHVAHMVLLPLALYLKATIKCKVVYDAHEFHAFSLAERLNKFMPFSFAKSLTYAIEGMLIRFCDGIVTIDSNQNSLQQRYYQYNRNVTVLYNVPPRHVSPDEHLLKALNIQYSNIPVIVYIGGITKEKGAERMIRMFSMVRKSICNARLVLVGRIRRGSQESFWRLAEEYDVKNAIDLVSWMPFREMCSYLAISKIGIALYEDAARFRMLGGGNGRKLFMYMYFAIPIVITNKGAVSRIVAEERCGVLINAERSEDVASAVIKLIKDEDLRCELGNAGRRAIANKYNWDIEKTKLMDLYEQILNT